MSCDSAVEFKPNALAEHNIPGSTDFKIPPFPSSVVIWAFENDPVSPYLYMGPLYQFGVQGAVGINSGVGSTHHWIVPIFTSQSHEVFGNLRASAAVGAIDRKSGANPGIADKEIATDFPLGMKRYGSRQS